MASDRAIAARLARSRRVRPTTSWLDSTPSTGLGDGIAEQREEVLELDGREALRREETEGLEVLAHVAGRLDHAQVQ